MPSPCKYPIFNIREELFVVVIVPVSLIVADAPSSVRLLSRFTVNLEEMISSSAKIVVGGTFPPAQVVGLLKLPEATDINVAAYPMLEKWKKESTTSILLRVVI